MTSSVTLKINPKTIVPSDLTFYRPFSIQLGHLSTGSGIKKDLLLDQKDKIRVDAADKYGTTSLIWATRAGHIGEKKRAALIIYYQFGSN